MAAKLQRNNLGQRMLQHPAQLDTETLLADCEVRRQRRSGPGGQHRNKVETAIYIRHLPTGIEVGASERRTQEQNRQAAIRRMRVKLAVEHRRTIPPDYECSELWRSRTLGQKIVVSSEHDDFASLLAEAIDVLSAESFAVAATAERLQCTTSQLIRFLKTHPPAIETVNRERQLRQLPPLR